LGYNKKIVRDELNGRGDELGYVTYLSGDRSPTPKDIKVDHEGNTYVVGEVIDQNFPLLKMLSIEFRLS